MKDWLVAHLVTPLHQMTWTERIILVIFGLWFGVFPVPGASTPLLLFGLVLVNRYASRPFAVSETTVVTAINIIATPICIALIPFWMRLGGFMFGVASHCNASKIIDELFVDKSPRCIFFS